MVIAWGAVTLPVFSRSVEINDLAARIIRGYVFQPQTLRAEIATLQAIENATYCEARGLRSDVIIRLRIAENSLAGVDIPRLDEHMTELHAAITKALSCSPTDAYLWLSLFWVNSTSEGFKTSDLALLGMSYKEAPNEGWIMVMRNYLALAIYPALPPDMADRTLTEFAELLRPVYVPAAVNNFVGPGWPIRDLLLERIKDTPESQRMIFAQMLETKGYDVEVPGIVRKKQPGH
jgi:hypothetical protein